MKDIPVVDEDGKVVGVVSLTQENIIVMMKL